MKTRFAKAPTLSTMAAKLSRPDKESVVINFLMPAPELRAIQAYCQDNDLTVSQFCRRVLATPPERATA